jgi:multiple sugar transport system substrate-binding protein
MEETKMGKKFRISAIALAVLMLVPLISGCNGSTKNSSKKTVTIAYQISGSSDPFGTWLAQVTKDYNSTNPNVKITPAPITADENTFYTKLDLEMKSSSSCPDVVTEDTFLINSDAAAGYLKPLTDQVNAWSDWSNFITNIKQGVTSSDKNVYGVPYSTDSRGLWYNKTVFTQAGLPTDWAPKSWNDILDACKAIKDKCPGVVPFWTPVAKAEGEATSMQDYEMLLYGTGERLLDSSNKYIVSSPNILASLNFINTVFQSGYGPKLSDAINGQASNVASQQYLNTGKLGIYLMGNWITSNYISTGASPWADYSKNLGFAAMPTNNGQDPGTITLAGGWALSIPKNSKNQDAAWDFIKFAMNKKNVEAINMAQGNLTTRSDVATDSAYTSTPFNDVASKFLETAQFRPTDTNYPKVSTEIQSMVESVATGTATPAQAMAAYATAVKQIVGDNGVVTK